MFTKNSKENQQINKYPDITKLKQKKRRKKKNYLQAPQSTGQFSLRHFSHQTILQYQTKNVKLQNNNYFFG